MTQYDLKQHDTAPSPRAQLLDGRGNGVQLLGATVRFKARRSPQSAVAIDSPAVVENPIDNGGALGFVHYDPQPADTAQPGVMYAEWEVTWPGGVVETFPGGDEYDLLVIAPDLDAAAASPGTGYCSRQQAREAGVTGTDSEVDAYIAAAEVRVDKYTGEHWRAEPLTVVAPVSERGVVLLPRQIDPGQAVTAKGVGATSNLPSTSYVVTSSRTVGQVDSLRFDLLGSDPVIAGAEPWSGGYRNLLGCTPQLEVTATFGSSVVPLEVQLSTALVAADIQALSTPTGPVPGPDADDEGNTVVITARGRVLSAQARTTGVPAADTLLYPLRKRAVRLS